MQNQTQVSYLKKQQFIVTLAQMFLQFLFSTSKTLNEINKTLERLGLTNKKMLTFKIRKQLKTTIGIIKENAANQEYIMSIFKDLQLVFNFCHFKRNKKMTINFMQQVALIKAE